MLEFIRKNHCNNRGKKKIKNCKIKARFQFVEYNRQKDPPFSELSTFDVSKIESIDQKNFREGMAQTFPDDDDLLDAEMEALLNDDDGVFESKTPILFSTSQGTPGQTQGEGLVDAKGERKEEEENEIGKGEEPFSEGEGDVDVDEEEEYEEEEEEEDDDDDDEGTLETSLSLRAVSQEWEAFSLSTKRATWDSQVFPL